MTDLMPNTSVPTPPQEPATSPTAAVTPDTLGLGSTSGQRGAEIIAALRAELFPSPETLALARLAGRAIAWMVMRLEKNPAALNFVAVRPGAMTHLVSQNLPPNGTFVDLAVGFHPRGPILARQRPDVRLIEVDLPSVITDRKRRLESKLPGGIPSNIEFRAADLGVKPLKEVLGDLKADVICSEGLNAYFSPTQITQIAAGIRECLKPGGVYVTDISWEVGMREAQKATRFFSSQAGRYLGIMKDEAAMRQLLLKAGYSAVEAHLPSKLAAELGLPTPVIDFAYFLTAKN